MIPILQGYGHLQYFFAEYNFTYGTDLIIENGNMKNNEQLEKNLMEFYKLFRNLFENQMAFDEEQTNRYLTVDQSERDKIVIEL